MKQLLLTSIVVLFACSGWAQTDPEKARVAYLSSAEAFKSQKYEECITGLKSAIQYLGTTNTPIECMKAKAYYQMKEYELAKTSIKSFLSFDPEINEDYRELIDIYENIDSAVQKEAEDKAKLQADEEAWKIASRENTLEAYQKYLIRFPGGSKVSSANEVISWLGAQKAITNEAYTSYISRYPRGLYYRRAKEEAAYCKAIESQISEDFSAYLKSYPKGKYAVESKSALEKILFSQAEEHFNCKDFEDAEKEFNKYLTIFSENARAVNARDRIKEITQILADLDNQKKKAEIARLTKLADERQKASNKQYGLGTLELLGSLALTGGCAYLTYTCYKNVQDNSNDDEYLSNLLLGLLGLAGTGVAVGFVINSFDTFSGARIRASEARKYRSEAKNINVSFAPRINTQKGIWGMAITFKF